MRYSSTFHPARRFKGTSASRLPDRASVNLPDETRRRGRRLNSRRCQGRSFPRPPPPPAILWRRRAIACHEMISPGCGHIPSHDGRQGQLLGPAELAAQRGAGAWSGTSRQRRAAGANGPGVDTCRCAGAVPPACRRRLRWRNAASGPVRGCTCLSPAAPVATYLATRGVSGVAKACAVTRLDVLAKRGNTTPVAGSPSGSLPGGWRLYPTQIGRGAG